MADPTLALQVQTPGVNGAANFAQGAAAKSDLDTAHLNQANASIGLMGQGARINLDAWSIAAGAEPAAVRNHYGQVFPAVIAAGYHERPRSAETRA